MKHLFLLCSLLFVSCAAENEGAHLFILSGQSNMVRLNADESFAPLLYETFDSTKVIIVKDAMGAQPIRRWYKQWKAADESVVADDAALYDSLMANVRPAIDGRKISTVTFVWMQGERDAREGHGDVYAQSLLGLYDQLSADLDRTDVNFVIGRLSDFDMANERYPHWTKVREAQVKVAEYNPRFSWVNTDDLNDGLDRNGNEITNDLHMSAEGYKILGKRFAEAAIQLIRTTD